MRFFSSWLISAKVRVLNLRRVDPGPCSESGAEGWSKGRKHGEKASSTSASLARNSARHTAPSWFKSISSKSLPAPEADMPTSRAAATTSARDRLPSRSASIASKSTCSRHSLSLLVRALGDSPPTPGLPAPSSSLCAGMVKSGTKIASHPNPPSCSSVDRYSRTIFPFVRPAKTHGSAPGPGEKATEHCAHARREFGPSNPCSMRTKPALPHVSINHFM
mmetsp:Transcript_45161/g.101975  ORF Transcript_45161/g.101975 Transcript_45161/m.101975 type:complete len:220 (-) Transcript_45161:606-1265(-)